MSCSAFSLFLILVLIERKHRESLFAEVGCGKRDWNVISSLGQNGTCLTKFAPESIQFRWFRIKTKFLIIAQINNLVFCQIGIIDLVKRQVMGLVTQIAATEPVGIIVPMTVFKFSRCVITLLRTFCSTGCAESEVISPKRRKFVKFPAFPHLPQKANFFWRDWTF
jgi:hypothetical protein